MSLCLAFLDSNPKQFEGRPREGGESFARVGLDRTLGVSFSMTNAVISRR